MKQSSRSQKQDDVKTNAKPRVGIVVLNYENAADTAECLASLDRLTYEPHIVCVVDNGSSPECVRQLRREVAQYPDVRFIAHEANVGYAAGNNVGIRAVLRDGADHVLILNNDTTADPSFLEPLVEALEADPKAAIAIPRFLDPRGRDITPVRRRPTYWSYYRDFGLVPQLRSRYRKSYSSSAVEGGVPFEVDIPMGACMLLRADFLNEIGLLDEGTFLYQEEVILAEQIRERGERVLLAPDAAVTHLVGRSTKDFRLRSTLALWRSQNYYLREYRDVRPELRGLLFLYQAVSVGLLSGAAWAVNGMRSVGRMLSSREEP